MLYGLLVVCALQAQARSLEGESGLLNVTTLKGERWNPTSDDPLSGDPLDEEWSPTLSTKPSKASVPKSSKTTWMVGGENGTEPPSDDAVSAVPNVSAPRVPVVSADSRKRPVVRLLRATDNGPQCTGTFIKTSSGVALLTAAHCFHELSSDNTVIGERIAGGLFVEDYPEIPAIVPDALVTDQCLNKLKDACFVDRDHLDVATVMLPFKIEATWEPCRHPPGARRSAALFGFGLIMRRTFANEVQRGLFEVDQAGIRRDRWTASNDEIQIRGGDSGGPGLLVDFFAPSANEVCFVISSTKGSEATLVPTWPLGNDDRH